jgi:hypothetical protein
MITLLASIAGFIGSIVPELIKYFKDINDKKHELQILEKQIEYSKLAKSYDLEAINNHYDYASQAMLYGTYNTNIKWVDALNGSVRPVLAYSFFTLYMLVKYCQYHAILKSAHFIEHIEIIWNVDDQAIFAGIISFYYGQRTFKRVWGGK